MSAFEGETDVFYDPDQTIGPDPNDQDNIPGPPTLG